MKAKDKARSAGGIFGPEWHKWRGATLSVALEGAPPFVARLDAVDDARGARLRLATLTVLDAQGRPTEVREVPWPPVGEVRVVRAP